MLIEDLVIRDPHGDGCQQHFSECPGGRVPTQQELIDILGGVWCEVDWDHSTGGRLQIHDEPGRYSLVRVVAAPMDVG